MEQSSVLKPTHGSGGPRDGTIGGCPAKIKRNLGAGGVVPSAPGGHSSPDTGGTLKVVFNQRLRY